jgi:tight adherence protein B
MNLQDLHILKYAALSCSLVSVIWLLYLLLRRRDTAAHHAYFRYVAGLERQLRVQFIELRPLHIVLGQIAALLLTAAIAVLLGKPVVLVVAPAIVFAPPYVLERMRQQRVARIEQKLDGFVLALANALRASPSAGRALALIQPVTPAPLDREIELVLREMRVGSTLEQALGNLSARVRSFQLDAAMSGLLIGRQTGGNVPEILDGAAQTLREIGRLQGVLRAKTAEGRAQSNVLAVAPLVLVFAFDMTSPGYFRPLTDSFTGMVILTLAIVMWVASIILTRRIMESAL